MGEFCFFSGQGRFTKANAKKIDRVAQQCGADLVTYQDPGSGPKYWFAADNRGDPFDRQLVDEVREALKTAGLWPLPTIGR